MFRLPFSLDWYRVICSFCASIIDAGSFIVNLTDFNTLIKLKAFTRKSFIDKYFDDKTESILKPLAAHTQLRVVGVVTKLPYLVGETFRFFIFSSSLRLAS